MQVGGRSLFCLGAEPGGALVSKDEQRKAVVAAANKIIQNEYQVIKKWLSYREQKLLGRLLKPEEVMEVTNMARRIAAILLLEPELDANYQTVITVM